MRATIVCLVGEFRRSQESQLLRDYVLCWAYIFLAALCPDECHRGVKMDRFSPHYTRLSFFVATGVLLARSVNVSLLCGSKGGASTSAVRRDLAGRRSFRRRNLRQPCDFRRRGSGKSARDICRSFPFSNSYFGRSVRSSCRAPPRRALLFAAPSAHSAFHRSWDSRILFQQVDRLNSLHGKAAQCRVVFPTRSTMNVDGGPRRSVGKPTG